MIFSSPARQFGQCCMSISNTRSSSRAQLLFTLLFVTGNTMMQATRERIPELATLKTLGFTDGAVSVLVLSESVLLCTVSAVLGLALASVLLLSLRDVLGIVSTPLSVVGVGILAAIAVAVISGAPPAWQARRLRIVDALSRK
jgi:putative ABC transport system permease protein